MEVVIFAHSIKECPCSLWTRLTKNCHSDPYGEESRFPTRIKPRFFTPLRSVQNDTIGVLGYPGTP